MDIHTHFIYLKLIYQHIQQFQPNALKQHYINSIWFTHPYIFIVTPMKIDFCLAMSGECKPNHLEHTFLKPRHSNDSDHQFNTEL